MTSTGGNARSILKLRVADPDSLADILWLLTSGTTSGGTEGKSLASRYYVTVKDTNIPKHTLYNQFKLIFLHSWNVIDGNALIYARVRIHCTGYHCCSCDLIDHLSIRHSCHFNRSGGSTNLYLMDVTEVKPNVRIRDTSGCALKGDWLTLIDSVVHLTNFRIHIGNHWQNCRDYICYTSFQNK